jgi:tetratricopeptide (TPR) repeat protein
MPSPLSTNEIREVVERACGSPGLAGAPRLQRLLRFLAEATAEGDPPKETVIGACVFDRAPDYDPKADSVARTEVRRLRLKLAEHYAGAGAAEPIRIEIPKGAYALRFERRVAEPPPADTKPPFLPGWRRAAGAAVILIPCAVAAVSWINVHKPPAGELIAVLPFQSANASAVAQPALSDLTNQVTESLSRVPALRVISRSSADHTPSGGPAAQAASLHAHYVVTGSLVAEGSGGRVRVTVLGEPGDHILARNEYSTSAADLPEHIADGIAHSVGARPSGAIAHTHTTIRGVQERFLEGRRLWSTRRKPGLDRSIELFREAAALDPDYVWDYVGMADSYSVLATNSLENPAEVVPKAEAAARRAVELSPDLAEAHASLGLVFYSQWNWQGADRELKEARRLNPNLSIALFRSAVVLCAFGRFDEALQTLADAEVIDPFSPFAPVAIAEIHGYKRDYQMAYVTAQDAQRRMPTQLFVPPWGHLLRLGRVEEARSALLQWKEHGADPLELTLAEILVRSVNDVPGARADFERVLQEGKIRLGHFQIASMYATLREPDAALEEVGKAVTAHETDLVSIQWDPAFDSLRSDPRYRRAISAMGLSAP